MSNEKQFMRHDGTSSAPDTAHIHSLEGLRSLVANAEREEREERARKDEAAQIEQEDKARRHKEDGEVLATLASYFEGSPEIVGELIQNRMPSLDRSLVPIFDVFLASMRSGVNRFAVAEALHCLAGRQLPALRINDKVLGPSLAKALRELPAFKPRSYESLHASDWFEGWCAKAGIAYPAPPLVDFETESQWNHRITANLNRGYYGRDPNEAHRLAALERELMSEKRRSLDAEADRERYAALEDLRARILSVVDPVVAALPWGPSYWYAREVRRVIAREPTRITPPMVHASPFAAWSMAQVLGVRFPFENLK